jgi:hypothetical protein
MMIGRSGFSRDEAIASEGAPTSRHMMEVQ